MAFLLTLWFACGPHDEVRIDPQVPSAEFGDAASPSFHQGSWRSPIRATDSDPANRLDCTDPATGWRATDSVALVDGLVATNQNFYAAHIDSLTYDPANCDWAALENIAAEIDARGLAIDLFAAFAKESGTALDHVAAVASVRDIAASYPSLKGFLIDDFHNSLVAPYTTDPADLWWPADVEQVAFAAVDPAIPGPVVAFIPYMADDFAAMHLVPAHILGVPGNWDAKDPDVDAHYVYADDATHVADELAFEHTFDPGPILPGDRFRLSLLHYDQYTSNPETKDLDMVVSVNGSELLRESLFDQDVTEDYIEHKLAALGKGITLLPSAPNTVRVEIQAGRASTNNYGHKLLYVWDVYIQRTGPSGRRVFPFEPDAASYITYRDPTRKVSTAPMMAQSNANWRIDDYIAGAFHKYTSIPEQIDLQTYATFLRSLCRHLNASGRTCEGVFWGNEQWHADVAIDLRTQSRMYALNEMYGDGIVVWRLENSLFVPKGGLFTDRLAIDPANYDVTAFFPLYTSGIPGLFFRWTYPITTAGNYEVAWSDNRDGSSSGHDNRMTKRVSALDATGEATILWESDINDAALDGVESFALDPADYTELTVEMYETDSIGNAEYYAQYRVLDPTGTAVSHTLYESDVDEDTHGLYNCTTAYYTSSTFMWACPPSAP